jgi:hypothetical protein
MKVTCINDKNQPQGAEVVKGVEYIVLDDFVNATQQRVFLISGICNKGTTKMGFPWYGYNSDRFSKLNETKIEKKELNYAIN